MAQHIGSSLQRLLRAGALLFGLLAPALQAATAQDAMLGTWLTDEGASKVEVRAGKAADGSTVYTGKLVWLKEPMRDGKPLQYVNNADAAQRERPLIGIEVLSGFKVTAAGWSGGMVYAPRAGKNFPADLSIAPDGRLQLRIKAGMLSKTDYWTR